MIYLYIIPLWLAVLGVMAVLAVVARWVPSLAFAYPWVWRMAWWSAVGLVLGNALLWLLLAVAALVSGHGASAATGEYAWVMLVGPLVVSAVGFVMGLVHGAREVWRRR